MVSYDYHMIPAFIKYLDCCDITCSDINYYRSSTIRCGRKKEKIKIGNTQSSTWNNPTTTSTGHASFTMEEKISTRGDLHTLNSPYTNFSQLEATLTKALSKFLKGTHSQTCQYQDPRCLWMLPMMQTVISCLYSCSA